MDSIKDYKVFVSSTSNDLKDERDAAFQAIWHLGLFPVAMEGFGAHSRPPIEVCRDKVSGCRYFVLIVGRMYGSTYDDGISYTEHEYEWALEFGLKVKVFMLSGDYVEERHAVELAAFKKRLKGSHTVQFFETAEQLGGLVKDALTEELIKKDLAPTPAPAPRPTPSPSTSLGAAIEQALVVAGAKPGEELATAWVGKVLGEAGVRWSEHGYPKLKAMLMDFSEEKGGFLRFRDVVQNGGQQTLVTYVPRPRPQKRVDKLGEINGDTPLAQAALAVCDSALARPEYAEKNADLATAPESFSAVNVPQNVRALLVKIVQGLVAPDVPSFLETAWAVARGKGAVRCDPGRPGRLLFPVPVSEGPAPSGYVEVTIMPSVKNGTETKSWYKPWFVCFVNMSVVGMGEGGASISTRAFRPIDALERFCGSSRLPDAVLGQLAGLALDERWTWHASAAGGRRVVLENYLRATFTRLAWQDGFIVRDGGTGGSARGTALAEGFTGGEHICISRDGSFAAFNTGLISGSFNDIYACLRREGDGTFSWAGFCTVERSDLSRELIRKIPELPVRARYFSKIGELLYDPARTLVPNIEHILVGNLDRLPQAFLRRELGGLPGLAELFDRAEHDEAQRGVLLARLRQTLTDDRTALEALENGFRAAVSRSKKLVEWDYKIAVPSYYPAKNHLNFLLPLCLASSHTADTALVVELLESGNYEGQTILTLLQAYVDARCIARPASEWLRVPEA